MFVGIISVAAAAAALVTIIIIIIIIDIVVPMERNKKVVEGFTRMGCGICIVESVIAITAIHTQERDHGDGINGCGSKRRRTTHLAEPYGSSTVAATATATATLKGGTKGHTYRLT